ncbi:ABC transporter ATP-binding protein [Corynebacterium aquatimens]|uniref:Trehalose import ATP-binding protein SugC n=1 Tax=Corynebacterium aquatimens TaxID=1190508 RepID=A0A931E187_9CORY|nr:ABC transporter ATP-binding protein [Corynebacterium aquatimens]MBG6121780.1 iron(III) transport system ATP-binding protein [Corynebacterium aquatimens]WJY65681.1 Spermidine/putrescine import ATP-binding protein PotA [Corynebacterium aquatimens]
MDNIRFDSVTVTFPGGTQGLKEVSLDVAEGEFVALVGPSGSGKTTLLRALAGFIEPSSGTITVGGRDMRGIPPEDRNMGMVFQQHAVWPHMSVFKNVAYPLERAGVDKHEREQRVIQALTLVGLEGLAERKPDNLSGGQRQRVSLARAIVGEPRVLLLDEALSALDEPLRDVLRRELVTLTRTRGLTTLHVTHDRQEALAMADRIAVLADGRLQQVASPDALYSSPASAWVAQFFSDATVLRARRDGHEFVSDTPAMKFRRSDVVSAAELGEDVEIAVLPSAVRIVDPHQPGAARGTVVSALFELEGYSVTVDVNGTIFRAKVRGRRPAIGENVGVRTERVLGYPATD